jgi:hypothetical protein
LYLFTLNQASRRTCSSAIGFEEEIEFPVENP